MGIGGSIVNTKLTVHLDELLDGITEANRHNEVDMPRTRFSWTPEGG